MAKKALPAFKKVITPKSKIPMITKPVERGIITSPYGQRVLNDQPQFHPGIDIGVVGNPTNEPVVAAKSGKIAWINENPATGGGFGKVVYVQLADGWYSIYPHMSSIEETLFVGKEIKSGDRMGIMGNTGYSFGIHLHYEERRTMAAGSSREPLDIIALYK
jgi:murein DD-endopeptidase MepM/ murein hydrolase activator NlpD